MSGSFRSNDVAQLTADYKTLPEKWRAGEKNIRLERCPIS
jgi:hypothetical protein